MDVFIHEDYVNKRNEVRREQRRRQQLQMLQVSGNPDASRPALRGSPGSPAPCVTPTGTSPSSVMSPTTASVLPASAEPPEHRIFDCIKPY